MIRQNRNGEKEGVALFSEQMYKERFSYEEGPAEEKPKEAKLIDMDF